jgi:NTE family protein
LGWAHIGIARVLQAEGIAVSAAAGTSIGALVAVAIAADALDPLEALARDANALAVLRFLDPHLKRGALLGARGIARSLALHLGGRDLRDLPTPCAVTAADLVTGECVAIASGPAVEALMASLAIPGIFPPVRHGERLLIDGGVLAPVPVAAARALSRRPVVAINLQADYPRRARQIGIGGVRAPSTLKVTQAGLALVLKRLAETTLALDPADLVLTPPVGDFAVAGFTRGAELIAVGEATARAALPAIRALAERAD